MEALKARYQRQLEEYKSQLDTTKSFLQAEIDKTILVTKVHFETEFEALKEVFAKLAEVKLQFSTLRQRFRGRPSGYEGHIETHGDMLNELTQALLDFQKAHNKLVESAEHLSAFYPQAIYEELLKCFEASKNEAREIELGVAEAFSVQWNQRGVENLETFMRHFNNVSNLIRERISKLAVVHST